MTNALLLPRPLYSPPCQRSLVNPCGRGVNAFALMLSKNSVQCVSNLCDSPPGDFSTSSTAFVTPNRRSHLPFGWNLIELDRTRIHLLGLQRHSRRIFMCKNTVVKCKHGIYSVLYSSSSREYIRIPITGTLLGII